MTLSEKIIELCESNQKVRAIKLYRDEMGGGKYCRLLDAKEAVDTLWYRHCEYMQREWAVRMQHAAISASNHR